MTYELLGLGCGMAASKAQRKHQTGVTVWPKRVQELGYAPKCKFMNINECLEYFTDPEDLILAATEQPIQRPAEQKKQPQ